MSDTCFSKLGTDSNSSKLASVRGEREILGCLWKEACYPGGHLGKLGGHWEDLTGAWAERQTCSLLSTSSIRKAHGINLGLPVTLLV